MTLSPVFIASIPSPDVNGIEIGPLRINFYGIAIALGVIAAIALASRRVERRGGDPRLMERAGVWGVAAGVLGARAAYVSTHTGDFAGQWYKAFYIWEGGLACVGGVGVGGVTVVWLMKRGGARLRDVVDSAADVAAARAARSRLTVSALSAPAPRTSVRRASVMKARAPNTTTHMTTPSTSISAARGPDGPAAGICGRYSAPPARGAGR